MRRLAIGDIHGCCRALTTLAAYARFQRDDFLITLGDYIDRGPDSSAVLDWLIEWQRSSRLAALRGNHEIMMLRAREIGGEFAHEWRERGGKETLASYSRGREAAGLDDIPEDHWKFLESTLPWFETDRHFFVHGSAAPDMPLEEQPDYLLYWERFDDPAPHESGKTMICGHTAQRSGVPRSVGHAVCIDTWAYGRGWLTCLDIDTGRYWQANQRGEVRSDWLPEPD